MFKPVIVIPARLKSVRCPGKVLREIEGKPMLVRVWEAAVQSGIGPVAIATPDKEVKRVLEDVGATVVLTGTPDKFPTGSDRIAFAAKELGWLDWCNCVVNLQGDTPFIPPKYIRQVVEPIHYNRDFDIATLAGPLPAAAKKNPNEVKMKLVRDGDFLRCVGFTRGNYSDMTHSHIGIYAYRTPALIRFAGLSQSANEKKHGLEQLRAMDIGMNLCAVEVPMKVKGFDTEEDFRYYKDSSDA